MKLRKRFAAIGAAMIMTIGVLGIEASAAGTISRTYSSNNVSYDFTVNKAGKSTNKGFYTSTKKYYTVHITPATDASASAKFYETNTTSDYGSINIPKAVPGMPTLTTSVQLPAKTYYVKINATNTDNSTYSDGDFTIYGVAGTATATIP